MKNILLAFFTLVFLPLSSVLGQKIKVNEGAKNIGSLSLQGFAVSIDLDVNDTQKKWLKQLKTYGKIIKNKNEYTITPASVPGLSTAGSSVYSTTEEIGGNITIWLCIVPVTEASAGASVKSNELAKQILHNFAATAYRDNINEQIKDAERALLSANKAFENKIKESEKLRNQINDNAGEKIELENKLKKKCR